MLKKHYTRIKFFPFPEYVTSKIHILIFSFSFLFKHKTCMRESSSEVHENGQEMKKKIHKTWKIENENEKMSYWANFSSFLHHLSRAEHKAHIAYIFLLLPCFPFFFGSLFKSRCCWMPLYFLCFSAFTLVCERHIHNLMINIP